LLCRLLRQSAVTSVTIFLSAECASIVERISVIGVLSYYRNKKCRYDLPMKKQIIPALLLTQ
ncbi:MAG: hypothetical protein RSG54_03610, partial [Clostridium sp.]